MNRSARQVLLCMTLFLVLFPLAIGKPGMPAGFKSDEPAYYLAALSLSRDGDLRCEPKDMQRLFDEFPYGPAYNLILMTDDGWRTVYFGKPYIVSLLAAPFAGLFGANGFVAFNMLLLMAMIWMGASYLRDFNPDWLAVAFSTGFFLLSSAFAYVFWMHPEMLNMASITASLYFALKPPDEAEARFGGRLRRWLFGVPARPLWSGACLAPAVYNKPMLALLALPALYIFLRRHGWRSALRWCAAALVAGGLICGISWALTGHASAYLGVHRQAWNIHTPDFMPAVLSEEVTRERAGSGSWAWIIARPSADLSDMAENLVYFFWGRHTGLFVYGPFALLSVLFFLLHGRGSRSRWLLAASLAGVALVFLLWIPFNYHGGGGFVGNRYYVAAYPGFLFLVTRVAPAALTLFGYAAGGLLLGGIFFTPYGAPVHRPTLQAHVRNAPFRFLPFEFSVREKIPGYWGSAQLGLWFYGRRDVFEVNGEEMWFHGRTTVPIWLFAAEPIEEATFRVRNLAPGNSVRLRLPGDEQVLEFDDQVPASRVVTLRPTAPSRMRTERVRPPHDAGPVAFHDWPRRPFYLYRLEVQTLRGQNAFADDEDMAEFFLGASLVYMGRPADLERQVYGVEWLQCSFPERAGEEEFFTGTVRFRNTSAETWPSGPQGRVKLAYHWLSLDGVEVVFDGRRTPIGHEVAPGETVTVRQAIRRPERPGRYRLQVDLIYEFVGWFSRRGAPTCESEVEIVPADPASASSRQRAR